MVEALSSSLRACPTPCLTTRAATSRLWTKATESASTTAVPPKRGSNQVSKVASQHNRARSNPNTAHSLRTTKLPPPTPRVLVRLILNIKHHNKIRRNRVRSSSHKISSRVMLPHQRSSRPKLRTVNFRVVHGQRLRSNPVSLKLKTVQLDSCRAEFSRRR